MKVSASRLPESQVLLEIEVEPEQMQRSLDRAYRRLVQRVNVPGFRKGKTPRPMLERHVGRDRLVHEALDILIPEAYNAAIDEQEIDAIGQPVIELVQEEPLAFKATVPIRPTVELGDYRSLRLPRPRVEPDAKDVDAALEELRHRYAVHEPVDRPVQVGDIVRADVRGVADGREIFADDDAELRLREGVTILLPGFAEGIIGAEKGVPKEIRLTMPQGSQPLSGKEAAFTVTVREVKQERLPTLDDAFAREVGEGFAGLDALRQHLAAGLRERLEAEAEEAYQEQALATLVEQAKLVEFPPVLVQREMDRLLRDRARAAGRDVDQYLEQLRRPLDELREELRPQAEERVRRSLVLSRLAEEEAVSVAPAETEAEIERIVGSSGPQAEQVRRLFSNADGREAIARSLLTHKTLARLAEIAGQEPLTRLTTRSKKRYAKAGTEESREA